MHISDGSLLGIVVSCRAIVLVDVRQDHASRPDRHHGANQHIFRFVVRRIGQAMHDTGAGTGRGRPVRVTGLAGTTENLISAGGRGGSNRANNVFKYNLPNALGGVGGDLSYSCASEAIRSTENAINRRRLRSSPCVASQSGIFWGLRPASSGIHQQLAVTDRCHDGSRNSALGFALRAI